MDYYLKLSFNQKKTCEHCMLQIQKMGMNGETHGHCAALGMRPRCPEVGHRKDCPLKKEE